MSKVLLKSLQPGIMVQHNSEPRFQLNFNVANPLEVDKEVADFLLETQPSNFEISKSKKNKKEED